MATETHRRRRPGWRNTCEQFDQRHAGERNKLENPEIRSKFARQQ